MSREPPCFTINACNRCRRRKAKCDPGIPSCGPCRRVGSVCEYTEPRSKNAVPRSCIVSLEDELSRLEGEVQQKLHQMRVDDAPARRPDASSLADSGRRELRNRPDLIQLEPGEDAHFLGVSSGMHLARSVLESAQRNDTDFQPGSHAGQPTSASSPATHQPDSPRDTGASWPVLPSRETAINLIDIFLGQYEVQYPIIVGEELSGIVSDCYGEKGHSRTGSSSNIESNNDANKDAWNQFILNMVFAISLVVLSRENPESLVLAKSFSAAAMADFSTIMQRKGVRTLQCLLFLLLWSILDSSSAPIWYISGLCMRMCVDLGFHSETTIKVSSHGNATESEMDIKRRLFWVTYTFDRTLGTLLGRPFTLSDSTIDVQPPFHSLSDQKRDQVLHWFKLQQLQSQIVYRLYSIRDDKTSPTSADNADNAARWKADMATQLRQWGGKASSLADPNGHSLDWWEYWHQNAILLLHRPSPLKPTLDGDEANTCCTAAQNMIQLSFTRLQRGSADFAWVDLHYQLMSGITLLFLVWKNGTTRSKAKTGWTSFKNCLMQWTYVLDQLARQWERISRARDVLTRLVDTTIDIVEKELCNKLSASDVRVLRQAHAVRISRNKTIIRQLGSPGTSTRDDGHSSAEPQSEPQSQAQAQAQVQAQMQRDGPTPPQQRQERSSYDTPSSDTAVNMPQPIGGFQSHTSNIYGMQVSPSHSGQPISPQWITDSQGSRVSHSLPLAPFQASDINCTPQDPVQLLDQQAWHGLELYESFGAIPENITMLDYFSTPVVAVDERGAPHGEIPGWPDSLTNSILNFQTNFADLGDFGTS